jgi:hypothetical protein
VRRSTTTAAVETGLLRTSVLLNHVSVTTYGATWNLETPSGWLASAAAQGASTDNHNPSRLASRR